jgi:hypothetical protein
VSFEEHKAVLISGGKCKYYATGTSGTLYEEKVFGPASKTVTISNDSATNIITFSFDGAYTDGAVLPTESITVNVLDKASMFIKGSEEGEYRLWAW